MSQPVDLPAPCLVALVGPGASGKSSWAAEHLPAGAIVSSCATRPSLPSRPTVADQVGRCRELVEAGVSEVVVRLPDIADPGALDRMGQVIDAFR